jgi:hypothetical protein
MTVLNYSTAHTRATSPPRQPPIKIAGPVTLATTTPAISGQYLAKNKLGKRARAQLAANILNGRVKVGNLTVRQTARLCRVSVPYINDAQKPPVKSESLAEHFRRSSPDEWRECARAIGPVVIWDQMIAPLV